MARQPTPIDTDIPIQRAAPAGVIPKTTPPEQRDALYAEETSAPKRGPGRPRKAQPETTVRAASPRPASRQATRSEPSRDLSRQTARRGAVVVEGRSGEVLTRRRTTVGDPFDVPKNEIPPGWSYQWNAVTVVNQEVREEQVLMYANGWRPVPASRHPGRWYPPDYDGAIIVQGLRLEERPLSLTQEALSEDKARAKNLVRDQTDSLRLTQKALPGAHIAQQRNINGMRMEIDPALDIERPSYQPADDDQE